MSNCMSVDKASLVSASLWLLLPRYTIPKVRSPAMSNQYFALFPLFGKEIIFDLVGKLLRRIHTWGMRDWSRSSKRPHNRNPLH